MELPFTVKRKMGRVSSWPEGSIKIRSYMLIWGYPLDKAKEMLGEQLGL